MSLSPKIGSRAPIIQGIPYLPPPSSFPFLPLFSPLLFPFSLFLFLSPFYFLKQTLNWFWTCYVAKDGLEYLSGNSASTSYVLGL